MHLRGDINSQKEEDIIGMALGHAGRLITEQQIAGRLPGAKDEQSRMMNEALVEAGKISWKWFLKSGEEGNGPFPFLVEQCSES